nr:nucleolar pre-ribosomal-associated protein 1 [Nomia melanderi]
MKLNTGNEESSTIQVDTKKKRKKTDTLKDEGASNMDSNNVEVVDKCNDVKTLKRNSPYKENGVNKKRKKTHKADSLEISGTSEHSVKTKDLKSMQSVKNIENDEENVKDDKNIKTQIENLDGKSLRAIFNSSNGLDYLKELVNSCNNNKNKDMAAEYLNAGGNILELLRLLDSADKKNIGSATTVFSAVRIMLIKIMAQYPQYQSSADGACRHLINSYLSVVHSMLSVQSNAKQRKTVLQLLAAIVSLGGNLPRELLAHLSLQPDVITSLVKQTKPTDNQNIRNCFIHFILAFLIEGNILTIRTLLNKYDLLSSIFPDLLYDSKDTVALVLTTLKTYILQNSKISKTMKLHVFSTSVVQNLVHLYNWKGPNNWPKNKTNNLITNPQYLEEKEIINEIVHDFLIVLLTSHRYGIVFHDHTLGMSQTKHNQLVNTVLQSLDRPWEHDKPSDLVIKIMTACPDLIKSQFTLLEPYIEPKVSMKWISAMKFVRKVIASLDAESCLKTCSSELSAPHLAYAVMSLTLSEIVLKHAILSSLTYSHMTVRHEAVLTLTTMFHQIQKFLLAAKVHYNEYNDFHTFRTSVLEYILKNAPKLNIILNVWSNVFEPSQVEDDSINKECIPKPRKEDHLAAILNLLHMYNEICPKLLHALVEVPATTFLNPLNTLENVNTIELNTIRIKAIQFLIILNPTEFSPQKKIFSNTLSFLLSLLNKQDSTNALSVKSTIKMLLNITGIFEGCNDQLDIWINGFINLDESEEIVDWFVHLIKKTSKDIKKYVNEVIEAEEIISEGVVQAGRLEDIFNEFTDRNIIHESVENNMLSMQRFTSVSPLLCCMLHKMKKNLHPTVLSYASYVLVHTLHYQVVPQCIIHLTKDIQELPVHKYLQSWLEGNNPIHVKEIFPCMDLVCKLNQILLDDTNIQISEVFNGDNTVTFTYNNEIITIHYSLSAYEIMYLVKMTIFYLTQFIKRGRSTETQINKHKILLISLLHLAKESSDSSTLMEECAKSVFTHPVILYYFSPFHQKSKDVMKSMITLIILDICKAMINMYNKHNLRTLVRHFKNKLLMQLHKMINKHQKSNSINDVDSIVTLLNLLQLTSQDVTSLLKKLLNLENSMFISKDGTKLSMYGCIIPKLIEIITTNEIVSHNTLLELDIEFVKCLCSHLLTLKSKEVINVETWEFALYQYISKFPFKIAGIDTDVFLSLLSMEMKHTTVRLLSFLISKNIKFIPVFTEYMLKSEKIREGNIVFPIISSNLNYKWSQEFMQKVKTHYETEILSYLCNPKDVKTWIEENVTAVSYLIKNTFDFKNCSEVCSTILQAGDKLDMVSIQYIQILESVYKKYATLETDNEKFITNLLQVLLHITTLTLKKESKNITKLHILCEKLNDAVKNLRDMKENFVLETLHNNHSWPQFSRFSLKLGFKELKNNKQTLPILKTLSVLCNIAYKNDSDNEYVKTLFEMTTSHSEFLDIMLESSSAKRDLVELLWILMQKNKTVIALSHVPVYLAAYNASLNEADQYLLLILQYYENNDINIYEYQPYLWGNAAAIHYSVKGDIHLNLWKQPSTTQVLNLLEEDIVNNTIRNYPVNRSLKATELHEAYDVYDPAFYLPLLCFVLSENNVVSCLKIAKSGALALAFVACSSNHSNVRMAAYTIIARYYTHLEASSSKSKLLWMRLIDALRYGITTPEPELGNVRVNCLVSTFLAKTSLIATQPLHPLYSRLQIFLMAKPALDVNTIPELLQLFHSSDVEYKAHRRWILENIRDGMKTESELDVAFKCVLFKMLLDFYTCSLTDTDTKKLILEIVCATLRITKGSILLIKGHGLLPWLFNITMGLHDHEVQYVDLIIKIVDTLLNIILKMKEDTVHYKLMLLNIVLNLKSKLPKNIKMAIFILYINILQKLLLSKHMKMVVTKEHVMEILEFSKKLLGNMDECENMLRFGSEYITKVDCSENDNEVEVARNCLRTMVWTWCNHEIR